MKKRSEFAGNHSMTLAIKCERGDASLELDISYLSKAERTFLFKLIQIPAKGGTVGFGVEPDETGRKVLKIVLDESTQVQATVQQAANGAH